MIVLDELRSLSTAPKGNGTQPSHKYAPNRTR